MLRRRSGAGEFEFDEEDVGDKCGGGEMDILGEEGSMPSVEDCRFCVGSVEELLGGVSEDEVRFGSKLDKDV